MKTTPEITAAAPDMLKALKNLLRANEELMPGLKHISVKDYSNINLAPIQAREAIKKAEGR